MINVINIVCDICETWFDLDEEFIHIEFYEDYDTGLDFSTHKKCLRELAD